MIQDKNYTNQPTPDEIDTEYRSCNFTQQGVSDGLGGWLPTRIFPGDDTPRTFVRCNMVNCEPPPGSTLIQCNTQLVEYDRDGSDHVHGRLNPSTFARESHAPESYSRNPVSVLMTVKTSFAQADALETALNARPDVQRVAR